MHSSHPLQARKQNLNLDLTAKEKEIFCALNFSTDQYIQDYQKQKAIELAELYAVGGEEASDKWKSAKYKAKVNSVTPALPNTVLKTENAYSALGWFNSTRLAAVRTNRVTAEYGRTIIPKTFHLGGLTLPSSIAGLSFGLELVVDFAVIIKSLLRPAEGERQLKFHTRLKNILTKDDRHYRMLNAALWFSINLSCFFLTGGMSAIVNLAGISGDVIVEGFKAARDVYRHHKLLSKVNNRIHEIDKIIRQHESSHKLILGKIKTIDNFERLAKKANTTIFKDSQILRSYESLCAQRDNYEDLKKERNSLMTAKVELNTKIRTVAKERLYSVFIAVAVLVGMALFFFPPAQPAVIGAFIALGAGSVMAGFCRRVWNTATVKKVRNKVSEFFNEKTTTTPVKHPTKKLGSTASVSKSLSIECKPSLSQPEMQSNAQQPDSLNDLNPKYVPIPNLPSMEEAKEITTGLRA